MEQIFIRILNMSFTAGIVILLVIILRLFLRRLPKVLSCLLWTVVLFRLLCPISFSSAVSLFGILRISSTEQGQIDYIPENIGVMEQPEVVLPVPMATDAINAALPPAAVENSANPMQVILFIGMCIWMSGILIMTIYTVTAYLKLHRRLRNAVKEKDNIYRASDITTPFVCGLFSPRIYLPEKLADGSSALGEREKQYILLHEQIHIKRRDYIWRFVSFLALVIHWFNPLVWLAFFLSGRDMEMSCDEAVIRKLGSNVKKEYSASLLALASGRRIVPGTPLAFGEGETGSRIKNVLRYKKPAQIALGAAFIVCIIAIVVLAANPGADGEAADQNIGAEDGQGAGEGTLNEGEAMDIYYGIVSDEENGPRKIVTIPGLGDVEIPEAEEIYPYIEIEEFNGPEAGDLIEISFPKEGEVSLQETYPSTFSGPAKRIVIMGQGFQIQPVDGGKYRFTIPWGLVQEAEEGDTLEIYRYDHYDHYDVAENGQKKELVTSVPVLSVDVDNYDVWVELSADEVNTFLAGFGRGIACEIAGKEGGAEGSGELAGNLTQGQETEEQEPVDGQEAGAVEPADGQIAELSAAQLSDGNIADGTYRVYVRSLSRSARGIDRYLVNDMEDGVEQPFLAFSEGCKFYVNRSMDSLRYENVSFEALAGLTEEVFSYLNPPFLLTFESGQVTEAILENYYGSGISYASLSPDIWYEHIQEMTGLSAEDALTTYYTQETEVWADVGDGEGYERIQVYTGSIGDGESGIVRVQNAAGETLYTVSAHISRAGWNNIYLGNLESRDGRGFIMVLHIDDRVDYGEYSYYVFRLSENGEIRQIAGSSFTFDDRSIPYDDVLFREWTENLGAYMETCGLLLSTQDGVLRTEAEREEEAERYSYEALRRGQ